jgi:hypothetical protein
VWKFVKKEALGSRDFASYEAFGEAIEDCLGQLTTRHKAQMDTLLTLNFQLFEHEPLLSA